MLRISNSIFYKYHFILIYSRTSICPLHNYCIEDRSICRQYSICYVSLWLYINKHPIVVRINSLSSSWIKFYPCIICACMFNLCIAGAGSRPWACSFHPLVPGTRRIRNDIKIEKISIPFVFTYSSSATRLLFIQLFNPH